MTTTDAPFPTPTDRIGLVGDTHGNSLWFTDLIYSMSDAGIKTIVQLGDFGWWPHLSFAFDVSVAATKTDTDVLFIDGNHEHHVDLRQEARKADPQYEKLARPVQLMSRLWYLPRGCAWSWQDVRFRALGGASSVDKYGRVEGISWFSEEIPTLDDCRRTINAGPADVFLTHDHPALSYGLVKEAGMAGVPPELARVSRDVRDDLAAVTKMIEPKLVVHGHWHHRYSKVRDGIRVEGLNCDRGNDSAVVLDLETLEIDDWVPAPAARTVKPSQLMSWTDGNSHPIKKQARK